MGAVQFVMCLSHPFNRDIGANAFCKVKAVIRWKKGTGASSFPFMSITETLAHGTAYEGSFTGPDPDDWVYTGNIGKLKLIDTGLGVFCLLNSWIIEGRHVLHPANLLKLTILISDGQLAELFLSPLGGYGVFRYGGVPLPNVTGFAKNCSD